MEIELMLATSFLVMCLLLPPGETVGEDRAKKDLELMQGTWAIQALEVNGRDIPLQPLQDMVLTVKADEYRTRLKDKPLFEFRLRLDPTQDPRAVDMVLTQADGTEKVHKAIYVIEN